MNLRETTRDIISLVEERTGFPVEVMDDPTLKTAAVVSMARRKTVPAHIIRYLPSPSQPPDYVICFECGYILRLFDNPPGERFEVSGVRGGLEQVEKMLFAQVRSLGLDKQQLAPIAKQMYDGMIVHLRSIPIGLRIAAWLADEYPELQDLQRIQVTKELKLNSETLNPEIRTMMPDIIYRASAAVNGAFALFWSHRYQKPSLTQPYVQAGYRKDAGDLMEIWNQVPSDPSHDRELIDQWGEALGLRTWYQWVPYQAPV